MEENSLVRDLITKILDETGPTEGSSSTTSSEKAISTLPTSASQLPKNDTNNSFIPPYSYPNGMFNYGQGENGYNFMHSGFSGSNFVNYNDNDVNTLLGIDPVTDSISDVTPEQLNLLRLAAQEIGGAQFSNPKFDEKYYNFFEQSQRNSLPDSNMFPINNFNRPHSLNLDMNYNNFEAPFNAQRFPNKFEGYKDASQESDLMGYINNLNLSDRPREENAMQNNMDFKLQMDNGHYQNEEFNKMQDKMFYNRNFQQMPPKNYNEFYDMMSQNQMGQNFDYSKQATPVSGANTINFKPNGFQQNEFMQRRDMNQMMPRDFQMNGCMNEQRNNFENPMARDQAMMRQNQEIARQMSLLMRSRPPPNQLNVDVSFLHENTPFNLGLGALLGPSPVPPPVLPSPMLEVPLLTPFYVMRNMRTPATPSSILHARLDVCYEQWRQLERERKRTEARLALAYPGRAVSSSNNIPVPRLPPCPTRVDRLTVDMLREHTKVLTLMAKMETLRSSLNGSFNKKLKIEDPKITVLKRGQENVASDKEKGENTGLDPASFEPASWREDVKNLPETGPHSEVESAMLAWRSAVGAVQAARRREVASHAARYVRQDRESPSVPAARAQQRRAGGAAQGGGLARRPIRAPGPTGTAAPCRRRGAGRWPRTPPDTCARTVSRPLFMQHGHSSAVQAARRREVASHAARYVRQDRESPSVHAARAQQRRAGGAAQGGGLARRPIRAPGPTDTAAPCRRRAAGRWPRTPPDTCARTVSRPLFMQHGHSSAVQAARRREVASHAARYVRQDRESPSVHAARAQQRRAGGAAQGGGLARRPIRAPGPTGTAAPCRRRGAGRWPRTPPDTCARTVSRPLFMQHGHSSAVQAARRREVASHAARYVRQDRESPSVHAARTQQRRAGGAPQGGGLARRPIRAPGPTGTAAPCRRRGAGRWPRTPPDTCARTVSRPLFMQHGHSSAVQAARRREVASHAARYVRQDRESPSVHAARAQQRRAGGAAQGGGLARRPIRAPGPTGTAAPCRRRGAGRWPRTPPDTCARTVSRPLFMQHGHSSAVQAARRREVASHAARYVRQDRESPSVHAARAQQRRAGGAAQGGGLARRPIRAPGPTGTAAPCRRRGAGRWPRTPPDTCARTVSRPLFMQHGHSSAVQAARRREVASHAARYVRQDRESPSVHAARAQQRRAGGAAQGGGLARRPIRAPGPTGTAAPCRRRGAGRWPRTPPDTCARTVSHLLFMQHGHSSAVQAARRREVASHAARYVRQDRESPSVHAARTQQRRAGGAPQGGGLARRPIRAPGPTGIAAPCRRRAAGRWPRTPPDTCARTVSRPLFMQHGHSSAVQAARRREVASHAARYVRQDRESPSVHAARAQQRRAGGAAQGGGLARRPIRAPGPTGTAAPCRRRGAGRWPRTPPDTCARTVSHPLFMQHGHSSAVQAARRREVASHAARYVRQDRESPSVHAARTQQRRAGGAAQGGGLARRPIRAPGPTGIAAPCRRRAAGRWPRTPPDTCARTVSRPLFMQHGHSSAVQAARRREVASHAARYVRQDPILQLAEAVKQLSVCARRARCAMWCDLTLTVALAPTQQGENSSQPSPVQSAPSKLVTENATNNSNQTISKQKTPEAKEEKPATESLKPDVKNEKPPINKQPENKPEKNNQRRNNYRKANNRNDFYQKNQRYDHRFMHNRHPYHYLATGPIN
ncbi:hypothetical protein ACJJTC_007380 [Scirpophaga incertulas]